MMDTTHMLVIRLSGQPVHKLPRAREGVSAGFMFVTSATAHGERGCPKDRKEQPAAESSRQHIVHTISPIKQSATLLQNIACVFSEVFIHNAPGHIITTVIWKLLLYR